MKKQSDIINDQIWELQMNGGSTEEVNELWDRMKEASLNEIKEELGIVEHGCPFDEQFNNHKQEKK